MAHPAHGQRRDGGHALILALAAAWAAPQVTLVASVSPDGRTVSGTLTSDRPLDWIVPLPLPLPDDELDLVRTFPGRVDAGEMVLTEHTSTEVAFTTTLPKRYGAVGRTAHGTYALGGFHPVPTQFGEVVPVDWTVSITLPPGRLGLVGQTVGEGTLAWTGTAERVALALPRRATLWEAPGGQVTVLGKGRPRRVLRKQLELVLPTVELERPVVVVEAPLRRRLHRHAPGVLFASDRYFQLTFLFRPYQRPSLVEGLAAADTLAAHPLERDLVGRATARAWERRHQRLGAAAVTSALSFVPSVDALLSSGRMAFFGETFRTWTPSDPVRDDVIEHTVPFRPGSSVAAQVLTASDEETLFRLGRAIDDGLSLAQGLQLVGLDPTWRADLTAPVPEQDYVLDADHVLRRDAPASAPSEWVEVRLDDRVERHVMAPGEVVDLGPADRVVVDPRRRVSQTSRMGDARPLEGLRVVTAAGITTLNLTRFRLEGSAAAWVRGRNDTRNLFYGALATSRSSTVSARLRYLYKFGPLRYGIFRRHRWQVSAGPALVNGRFQSLADGRLLLSGATSWSWSNREASQFPLRGSGLGASLSGGFHPGSDARWGVVGASVSNVQSFHPRHAIAFGGAVALARATRDDRALGLGGQGGMASVPILPACTVTDPGEACLPQASERLTGSVEYRVVAVRGARIPLVGAWGRELVLSGGLEGMAATPTRGAAYGMGALVGVSGVYDLFGADPGIVGLTFAWPVWLHGLDEVDVKRGIPEVYLRWSLGL